jgi:hypothetical integral membrane protein (TIGR02206 family)
MARVLPLFATAVVAGVLGILVRRRPAVGGPVRGALAIFLLGGVTAYLAAETASGHLTWWDFVPLELCDFAIFVAAFALVTRQRLAAELVWFWGLSGTVLAMATPDLPYPFPDWRWFAYYGMHGAVVVSAIVLAAGLGLRPRPGAPWRVFGWTVAYAAVVAIVDLATGANFLYLRHKPAEPTLLDWFGPWPVYLAVAGLIGLALFHLLMLPFRDARVDA